MIAYVYWNEEVSSFRLTCINIATLTGTLFGQILFGFLGDQKGRKKMYGIELVLLIGATLGVVMSSRGYNGSMSVYAWLIWWRIIVGIGVGADYPLSAVITAESVEIRSGYCVIVINFANVFSIFQIRSHQASSQDDGHRFLHAAARADFRKCGLSHRRQHLSKVEP